MQTYLFNPLFWVFIAICCSMFSKKKGLKILALLFFLLMTNEWLAYNALYFWEHPGSLKGKEIIEFDIGIVLGPFIEGAGEEFSEEEPNCQPNNRLQGAIDLYQQGKFKKFLLSGNDNIQQAEALLLHLCVPPEAILVEGQSKNTYENAFFTKKLLTQKGYTYKNILLITSASHIRRAKKCFTKVGVRVLSFSVDYISFTENYFTIIPRYMVPNEHAVVYWRILLREWGSMLVFWFYGYI